MTAAADELSAVSPFGSVPTIISCHGFILPEIFLYINSRAILPHTVSVPKLGTSRDIECYTTYVSVPWIVPAVFRASIATSPLFNTST